MSDRRYARRVVLAIFAFFGVVFAVNGTMIYLAVASKDGLVEKDYYLKGLHYNRIVQARQRYADLGWTAQIALARRTARLKLTDAQGRTVRVPEAHLRLLHPTRPGHDQDVTLKAAQDGTLRASLTVASGLWNVEARLNWQGQPVEWHARVQVAE